MKNSPARCARCIGVNASAEKRNRLAGILCGIAVVILFSSFTLMSRLGFSSSLNPLDLAALRFGIGGMLLLPVFLRFGLAGLRWFHAMALAFLGGIGFALFAYAGFALAPASHGAVLLHGTLSLFTFALMQATSRSLVKSGRAFGFAMIALGVIAMAWDSLSGAMSGQLGGQLSRQLIGDGSLLLASLCWSAYGLLARRLGVRPAHAAAIVAVFSMCCFFPIYLTLPAKTLLLASWHDILLQGVFQGILIGALSVFIYTRAVAALGAVETALFTAAVPCVTTVGAVLLLAESPSPVAWCGVVAVTVGMSVALRA